MKYASFFRSATIFCLSAALLAAPWINLNAVFPPGTVTISGDTSPNTMGVADSDPGTGDLRYVLNYINQNPPNTYNVVFNNITPQITLGGTLPILNLNALNSISIDGSNGGSQIIIDGSSTRPGFFAHQGSISLSNMTIQNTQALGGIGSGGGMGAGGALFINSAFVDIQNMTFSNCSAVGGLGSTSINGGGGMYNGSGGLRILLVGGAGGGGIGGLGGNAIFLLTGSGGGGGGGIGNGNGFSGAGGAGGFIGSPGSGFGAPSGGSGGAGSGGLNAGGGSGGSGVIGGGGGGAGGISTTNADGGAGNFGGGGGGGTGNTATPHNGGAGGFGGGGGGTIYTSGVAGNGGFGGGGGSGNTGGSGGFGGGGGNGGGFGGVGAGNNGGGGAGLGGAIFINGTTAINSPSSYYQGGLGTGGGGALSISGTVLINGNSVAGGSGASGRNGAGRGSALFITTGSLSSNTPFFNPLIFNPALGNTITLGGANGSIADDSPTGLPGGTYAPGTAAGIQLVKIGQGTLILQDDNFYGNGTFITAGTVQFNSSHAFGNTVKPIKITGASMLQYGTAVNLIYPIVLTDTLTVDPQSFNTALTGSVSGSGALVKIGNGTLTLTGTNTYAGGTIVNSGTLVANTSSLPVGVSQPSVTINNNGKLNFNQNSSGTFGGSILLNSSFATLEMIGTDQLTLSGAITGSGQLVVNSGEVILTNGGNAYTGGTQVVAGATLQGDSTSLQGAINDNGQLIFNQNVNGSFTGTISSNVSNALITKTGPGTVTFANDSSAFLGTTTINQGLLLVNSFLGGSVNVSSLGSLGGTGTILGNVTNNGIVKPGNSIGTLTINGNYVQSATGIYEVEIDGFGDGDLLEIGGSASLAGSLVIIPLGNTADFSQTYTILEAGNGVSGVFTNVTTTNPLFVPTVEYFPNEVVLSVQSVFNAVAINHNEREVANQLNSITNPTAAQQAILTQLSLLAGNPGTVDQIKKALDQMSGEQYTNCLIMSELASRQFLRRLYDPLREISACTPCCSTAIDTWFEVGGGHTNLSHDRHAEGFKMDSYEITLGAQKSLNSCWTAGVAGAYQHDKVHDHVGGSGKNSFGMVAAYGLFRPCSYYLLGDLVFDIGYSKVRRSIDVGTIHLTARSQPKSLLTTLYVEAGKDFTCNCFLFQPFIALECNVFRNKKLQEHGAAPLNLRIDSKTQTNAYSRLGLHLTSCGSCWKVNFDLAWQYRLTSLDTKIRDRFIEFGHTMDIMGVAIPRTSFDAAAEFSLMLQGNWELFAEFAGQRWSRLSTYSALGGLKFSW